MSSENDHRVAAGLLILRVSLGAFLLQWSLEKLILPSSAIRIGQHFYHMELSSLVAYALGVAELVLTLALLVGAFRTISYGLALAIHTVTVIVSWRQWLDPFGLAKVGNHLWIAIWPAWGGFLALFVMRRADRYTMERWFETRVEEARQDG